MQYDYVKHQIEGDIAIVTIHNPPVNALTSEAWGELDQIFYDLGQMNELHAIILTGECEKPLFVGGSNVREFLKHEPDNGLRYTLRNNNIRFNIYRCPKPVICALNGSVYGGGLGLALMCDYRIAPPNAKLGVGEMTMGILGFTQFLARRVHSGIARRMVYSGLPISAQEALQSGLVDEVLPLEEIMPRAMELAKIFASRSPIAIRRAKECMLKAEEEIFTHGGQDFEDQYEKELWGTLDQKEAVNAFLEKRQPVFQNK